MAHRLRGEVVSARIIKQFGSDTVKVSEGIRQAIVDIQRTLPKGVTLRIVYDQSYFDMPPDSVARDLPKGAGFAGFKIQEARDGALDWRRNDWVAFLGAAYFRAIGELRQYGLSARGVLVVR